MAKYGNARPRPKQDILGMTRMSIIIPGNKVLGVLNHNVDFRVTCQSSQVTDHANMQSDYNGESIIITRIHKR